METSIHHKNKDLSIVLDKTCKEFYVLKIYAYLDIDHIKMIEQEIDQDLEDFSSDHLIIILDFAEFKGISFEARNYANKIKFQEYIKLDLVVCNLNPIYKAELQFLFNEDEKNYLYEFDTFNLAKMKAFELTNAIKMEHLSTGPSILTGVNKGSFKLGHKEFILIHDKRWEFNDPKGTYNYEIDLMDSNVFISRPAGFIEFDNSINANVLFDKVVFEVIGHDKSYYRVQDYTAVEKTSYSARRDFTNYIVKNIHRIELMVFYGLNPTMKAIVKIGKLVHPSFSKVKICNSFDEAIGKIMNHKYGESYDKNDDSRDLGTDLSIDSLRIDQYEIQKLFNDIGKILWSPNSIPDFENQDGRFSEIYQALHVLKNDFDEILSKKERSIEQMHKQLFELSEEIKKYRQEIRDINVNKQAYTKAIHYETRTPIQSILTASELYQLEKNELEKQKYLKIILDSSRNLSFKMREQSDRIIKNQNQDAITTNLFNLNQNIINNLEVYNSIAAVKEIDVIYEAGSIEDYFIGDLQKINSIIEHLVLNAIQNSSKGQIYIQTELVEHYVTRQKIKLSVKDHGFGLNKDSESFVRKIFEGNRIDPLELRALGFGNGLVVCQKLAELLNGKLQYTPHKTGSIFSFELSLDLGVFSKELNLLKRTTSINHLKLFNEKEFNILLWRTSKFDLASELLVLNQFNIQPILCRYREDTKRNLTEETIDMVIFEYEDKSDLTDKVSFINENSKNTHLKKCGITTNISLELENTYQAKLLDYNLLKPYSIKSLIDIIKDMRTNK